MINGVGYKNVGLFETDEEAETRRVQVRLQLYKFSCCLLENGLSNNNIIIIIIINRLGNLDKPYPN
jgi:hypothetical protein